MRYEKWRQRIGLITMLLATGLIGGLLTPIQSEAQTPPILKIGNQDVALDPIACPSGYNICWVIRGANNASGVTYNGWVVKDISSTNRARVLLLDQNTAGSVDKMRFSGVNLTPVDKTQTTKTTTVFISYKYTLGQPAGDYVWAEGLSGVFDPTTTETVVGDSVKLVGKGTFPNPATGITSTPTLGTIDSGTIADDPLLPWSNDQNASITKSLPATVVLKGCNTGSSVCVPTIEYTFTVSSKGGDALVLNDSGIMAFGTCRDEVGPVPDVPPGTPDPLPPGPVCRGFMNKVNQVVHGDALDGIKFAKSVNATPITETCSSACGGGTIIIKKIITGTDATDGTFGFTGTGEDMPAAFDITTDKGTGSKTFFNISTGAVGGVRVLDEATTPETDGYHGWTLNNVDCTNTGGENSTNWTKHYDTCEGVECFAPLLGVTVNNLADGDTLECTFTNKYYTID